jgi:CBS domain-containing protein
MNIAFFLTPKREVVWLPAAATLAEALESLRPHRYSAVPILDEDGSYLGTLTEGDILWHALGAAEQRPVGAADFSLGKLYRVQVRDVPRRHENRAVHIDAEVEALVARAVHQTFVPVVDDREVFIGIVRRQHIIEHLAQRAGLLGGMGRSFDD